MFVVGRAIAGAGSSGISNGALTIISAVLPPRAQARFLGVNMGLGQLGLALGPVVGGLFTEHVSWRWCFYINLPIGGVVAILLLLFRIPEPEPKPPARQVLATAVKSLDLPGFMLISPAAVMFLLGLQYGGNQFAWDSPVVIGLLAGAAATFGLFLFWERRQGDDAMVPFAMLTHRIIWSAAGNMFFLMASVLVADFYLAIYFQAVHDDSPLMSGVHMLPTTLGIVLFTIISGTMIEKLGYYLPWVVAGGAVSAVGYGVLSLLSPTTPVANWIGYQIVYGVGNGCMAAGVSCPQGSPIHHHPVCHTMKLIKYAPTRPSSRSRTSSRRRRSPPPCPSPSFGRIWAAPWRSRPPTPSSATRCAGASSGAPPRSAASPRTPSSTPAPGPSASSSRAAAAASSRLRSRPTARASPPSCTSASQLVWPRSPSPGAWAGVIFVSRGG